MPLPVAAGAAMVGGNLISGLAGNSAVRRKNNLLTQGIREQSRAGMDATSTMGDFISQLRNTASSAGVERGAFASTLRGAPAVGGPMTAGAQFRTDAAGATGGAQAYGAKLADLFARIRAPQMQRQRESEVLMRMGDALRPIQARASDEAFLTQLRTGMVQPNPWQQIAGQGIANVGSYYGGKG